MIPAPPKDDDWHCCDDDWSVWLRFETWVWAVLLLVQLSMITFLVIHGRKDSTFRQAFYVFFVVVTLVDCALALLRQPRGWFGTLFGTLYDDVRIKEEDPETLEMIYHLTIRTVINKIVAHAGVPALSHAQQLFLTAIAVNRFTAFAFPMKHASMWSTRTVVVVSASFTAISVILGAAYPIVAAIHQAVMCPRLTRTQRAELRCDLVGTCAFDQVIIPTALLTFTSALCCLVSVVLNMGSIAMLIVLRITGTLKRKGPELQLFAHSLYMFLLQLSLAFQDIVFIADHPEYVNANLKIWDLGFELEIGGLRHSSDWLAGVKPRGNWTRERLDSSSGCALFAGYPSEELLMCPAWYLLLTGELRLGEDSNILTVRTLELCLIALSGSFFLLIISGNVRNAYFKFYFKWQCLSKKWGQNSSVKLFTRTSRRVATSSETTPPTMSTSSRP